MSYSREIEEKLILFCVEQKNHFEASAWDREYPWGKDYMQIASYLLSGIGRVPRTFSKTFAHQDFRELVEKYHFDCARFFSLLENQSKGTLV
jgi:hypothetical protein